MSLLYRFARRFVAGEILDAAIEEVKRINETGLFASLDFPGENMTNKEEAERAASTAITMIEEIDRLKLKANISIKLTRMGLDIGNDFCREQIERIAQRAADLSTFVRIDMEGSAHTERTLHVFKRASISISEPTGPHISIAGFVNEKKASSSSQILFSEGRKGEKTNRTSHAASPVFRAIDRQSRRSVHPN